MMVWFIPDMRRAEELGFIPQMVSDENPEPAVKQLDANYTHGGGWRAQPGFTLQKGNRLKYPGDPPFAPIAWAQCRDELICVYQYGYVAVIQKDGSFEAARMD